VWLRTGSSLPVPGALFGVGDWAATAALASYRILMPACGLRHGHARMVTDGAECFVTG